MYSEKVMDHFSNPRNVGEIENASGVGTVGRVALGPKKPGSRCPVGFQKGWVGGRVGGPCLCWTAPALAGTQTSGLGSECP